MDILYRRGRATGVEVMEDLPGNPSYSTVRTQLRVLEKKGHVRHEEHGAKFIYLPAVHRRRRRASRPSGTSSTRSSTARSRMSLARSSAARARGSPRKSWSGSPSRWRRRAPASRENRNDVSSRQHTQGLAGRSSPASRLPRRCAGTRRQRVTAIVAASMLCALAMPLLELIVPAWGVLVPASAAVARAAATRGVTRAPRYCGSGRHSLPRP